MANISGFNANNYGEMRSFDAVPAQKVLMMIVNSELKPTKDGGGQRLSLEMDLMDGPQKGRKVFVGLNLVNKNKQAEDIAGRELAAICKALGKPTPNDSAELHHIPFIGDIGVKPNKETKVPENHMKGYEPVGASVNATAQALLASAGNNGIQVQPGTAAAAGAPQASATPPWKR